MARPSPYLVRLQNSSQRTGPVALARIAGSYPASSRSVIMHGPYNGGVVARCLLVCRGMGLWGPKTSSISCDLGVFMDDAAKAIASLNLELI
jgi:hypothetical protein